MKTTGLIVEYNPLHNGHLLHIQEAKRQTEADIYIAVMSGNYVQRGEPALLDKWSRTEMALKAGIDLVIELPFLFATQNANAFADAAVFILKQMQVDHLVFGTEDGDLKKLKQAAIFLQQLPKMDIAAKPNENYAQWLGYTMKNHLSENSFHQPNQILGIQYLRAISEQKSNIRPVAIKRSHANYHEPNFSHHQIASATSIRQYLYLNPASPDQIKSHVPSTTYPYLWNAPFVTWDNLFPYLQMKAATSSKEELAKHLLVCEGIEARVKKIIPYARSFQEGMKQLKTKRYTWTRLMRTLLHMALNTKKEWENFSYEQIPYIKILGFNEKGRKLLHEKKKNCPLPFVHQPKNTTHPLMNLEDQVDMLYALLLPNEKRLSLMQRRLQGPVQLNNEN